MCGRYTLATEEQALIEAFDVPPLGFDFRPRWNIAPGQFAPVVAQDRAGRRMGLLTWGLVPSWTKQPGKPFINARAESVASKPSFREAYERRRCLVPADGFYEWTAGPSGKTPHWLHPPGGGVVAFAGIWERWAPPDGEARFGFAVLTADANDDLRGIHHRMPVVIPPERYRAWLDRGTRVDDLRPLLAPAPTGTFEARQVSTRVNRPSEDDAGLVEPVG